MSDAPAPIGHNAPPADPFIVALEERNTDLTGRFADLELAKRRLPREVTCDADVTAIAAWVVDAQALAREADKKRLETKKPFMERVSKIDTWFTEIRDGLRKTAESMSARSAPYLAEQDAKRRAAAEAAARTAREAREAAERQAREAADRARAAEEARRREEQRLRDAEAEQRKAREDEQARLKAEREIAIQTPANDTPVQDAAPSYPKLTARDGGCEEADTLSHAFYMPCNRQALHMVRPGDGSPALRMCPECANHNVRNRGAEIVGPYPPTINLAAAAATPVVDTQAGYRQASVDAATASRDAQEAADALRRATAEEERATKRASSSSIGQVRGAGAAAKVEMIWTAKIVSYPKLIASCGPIGSYLNERILQDAADRAARGDRPPIPGVEYFETPKVKTTAKRG